MDDVGGIFMTTRRMSMRQFTIRDIDVLHALDGDPEVMRYLSRTRTSREFISRTLLPNLLQEYREYPDRGAWAAISKETGDFIGWFSLRAGQLGSPPGPELGYRLRRACWGQGLATEGAHAIIDLAFRDADVERVWAQTMAVNNGSRRVMEKCGMSYIRTFHELFDDPLPGTEQGEVEYAITREQWMADQCTS